MRVLTADRLQYAYGNFVAFVEPLFVLLPSHFDTYLLAYWILSGVQIVGIDFTNVFFLNLFLYLTLPFGEVKMF